MHTGARITLLTGSRSSSGWLGPWLLLLLPCYLRQFHLLSTGWERKGLVFTSLEKVKVKVAQSCPTLCDPMDCTIPWTVFIPWNSPGQNTGVSSLSLLQGIFPTQGSNPGLPYCRRILYQLSYQGSPSLEKHDQLVDSMGDKDCLICIKAETFQGACCEALPFHSRGATCQAPMGHDE